MCTHAPPSLPPNRPPARPRTHSRALSDVYGGAAGRRINLADHRFDLRLRAHVVQLGQHRHRRLASSTASSSAASFRVTVCAHSVAAVVRLPVGGVAEDVFDALLPEDWFDYLSRQPGSNLVDRSVRLSGHVGNDRNGGHHYLNSAQCFDYRGFSRPLVRVRAVLRPALRSACHQDGD